MSPEVGSDPLITIDPLVVLSLSDYVTRRGLQKEKETEPLLGALLGGLDGKNVAIKVAFKAKVVISKSGEVVIHDPWFTERLQQFQDVYKEEDPPLELVGWWALGPRATPLKGHKMMQLQMIQSYTAAPLFLLFHPSTIQTDNSTGSKLPMTIFESTYGIDDAEGGIVGEMEVDGQAERSTEQEYASVTFRQLPYEITTDKTEMMALSYVAKDSGNVTAPNQSVREGLLQTDAKGKGVDRSESTVQSSGTKEQGKDVEMNDLSILNLREAGSESLIATLMETMLTKIIGIVVSALTVHVNATKQLQSHIHRVLTYLKHHSLSSAQPSPATGSGSRHAPEATNKPKRQSNAASVMREARALTAQLALLNPALDSNFERNLQRQRTDVAVLNALAELAHGVNAMKKLGRKWSIVENSRSRRAGLGMEGMGPGMTGDDFDQAMEDGESDE